MKKLRKLLTTVIGLATMSMNASNKEIQQIQVPQDLMPAVVSYLELKDMTRLYQTHKWTEMNLEIKEKMYSSMIDGLGDAMYKSFDFYMLILASLFNAELLNNAELTAIGISAQQITQHLEQVSGISPIPIPELLDKITTFVEKNASSRVCTKRFIFPRQQNENCGSTPQNSIAAQGFVDTEVTESCVQISFAKLHLIDLILSSDRQSIVGTRGSLDKLILFKDINGIQNKVSNTNQNRALAFMISHLDIDKPEALALCLSYGFSGVERIDENEIVGFFDSREPTMLMNLQAFVSRHSNRMFAGMRNIITRIC